MFVLTTELLVKEWPATIEVPVDGGEIKKYPIKLDLLILDTEEGYKALNGDEPTLRKIIKGFSGIGDKDGNAMAFSAKALTNLIKNPFFIKAVIIAYQQASSGQAAQKNS